MSYPRDINNSYTIAAASQSISVVLFRDIKSQSSALTYFITIILYSVVPETVYFSPLGTVSLYVLNLSEYFVMSFGYLLFKHILFYCVELLLNNTHLKIGRITHSDLLLIPISNSNSTINSKMLSMYDFEMLR